MQSGYLRQAKIWSLLPEDHALPPGLQDVRTFLDVLGECDQEMRRALIAERAHGRDDYPVVGMWALMALQLFLRKGRFTDLLGELRRNADLARLLGFNEVLPGIFALPDSTVVSRMHKKLKQERYQSLLKGIQEKTVALLRLEDPSIGEHTAEDCTDIRTHGHAPRHKSDKEKERPATDPEATWSVKTRRWTGADGKKREEKKCTFGYKACLNVDVRHPVILELQTVTGSTSDQHLALPVLEGAVRIVGKGVMQTCTEDKGFDSEDNVKEAYRDLNVAVIVPTRDVPANLDKLPPEDREINLQTGGNVVRDKYTGEITCYEKSVGSEPIRREMKYAGFDKDREVHKFRCPLGTSASTSCRTFASCSAGLSGEHGRQVRVNMKTDYRRFAPVYPRSKKWKRLYDGRSAVERVNSYIKEVLRLEDHCLRGLKTINTRVLLAAVTLNLRTLLAIRAGVQRLKAAG